MTPPTDTSTAHADEHPDPSTISPLVRAVLLVVGTVSLALGVIGIFLPVLPTTPFLLVTAACYARASTRLYAWLLGQPSLGPIITAWRRSRSLPPGVKTRALVVVAITFVVSIALVDSLLVRAILVVIGAILVVFLYRIPTARPEAESVNMGPTSSRE
ncbi:MAG: YbaN family protein [Chloroflexota bacterium]|jgi:hypothetical protein